MQTKLFDFDLPPRLIALRPAEPRDSSRLLVVHPGGRLEHWRFRELGTFLHKPDILAFNDSKVIPARMLATRPARTHGAAHVRIEVTLHRRKGPDSYLAFVKPAKRLVNGDRLDFAGLSAHVEVLDAGEVTLTFDCTGAALDAGIARAGVMPLPPYIAKRRMPDAKDLSDYQTIYAREEGSVAAPTAGLHFTPQIMAALKAQGVAMAPLTLHVGAGTFLPVSSDDTMAHVMHAEHATLGPQVAARLNAARQAGGRVCAVGTTSLRTLESAAGEDGKIHHFDSDTAIFITPGYRFRAVDLLVTNFHLPKSTLFMLTSAFMGLDLMQAAYAEAIRQEYRFYSYGDACLLIRPR